MRFELAQIADVTYVIALARLIGVQPLDFPAAQILDPSNRFENGDAIAAPAPEVIDLAAPRIRSKCFHRGDDVVTMNVIPHLLAFISVDCVSAAGKCYAHEIRKESVQLDPAVIRSRQTAAAEDSDREIIIASIFLRHHIGGDFRSAEDRVHRTIDAKILRDAFEVFRIGIIVAGRELFER